MVKIIIILYIGLISVICLNKAVLNFNNLTSLINVEYLVESNIHLVEDNYEEESLLTENNTGHNTTSKENLSGLPGLLTMSGTSNSIWQPPE